MQKKLFFFIPVLFFLSVNCYEGFVQDGILYTLQAINYLFPGRFVHDPAFMFGNQDSFSIFSYLYSFFIRVMPISCASFTSCFIIHLLFAIASCFFVCSWWQKMHLNRLFIPVILLYFCLFAYGENRNEMLFSVKTIEQCVVARTLSAALGFVGLANLLDKKKKKSVFWFILGTAIHPLTAGWCLPLWLFYFYPRMILPIVFVSILFPLTILIDIPPFAKFPINWVVASFDIGGMKQTAMEMLAYLLFFLLLYKIVVYKYVRRIIKPLVIVLGIALYWFVMGVMLNHEFLVQVQSFRIVWLCQIFVIVMSVLTIFHLYLKVRRGGRMTLWEAIFVPCSVVFWTDSVFILALSFAVYANIFLKEGRIKTFLNYASFISVPLCSIVSFGLFLFLLNQRYPLLYDNCSYLMQYLLQIVAVGAIFLVARHPKVKFPVLILLLFCLFMSISGKSVFDKGGLAKAPLLFSTIIIFLELYGSKYLRFNICNIVVLSLCMVGFSFANYDKRSENQKSEELIMDEFVEKVPFPYVKDRGRILFAMQSYGSKLPRISFLSGTYFDSQYEVGLLFYHGQKTEIERRVSLIVGESELDGIDNYQDAKNAALRKLSNEEGVLDVTRSLCEKNEITHMVTDLGTLPLIKNDSLIISNAYLRMYLYSCK